MSATEINIFDEDTARRVWEERRQRVADAEPGETVDFSDMEFSDDPADQYFRRVEFSAIADFTGSIFRNGNVFGEAIFHEEAIFNNAIFKEKSDFPNVVFEDKVSFDETIFSEAVGFHSNFQNRVFFERAIFQRDALFGDPAGSYLENIPRFKFGFSVSFEHAEFKSAASFDNLDFDGDVSFKSTKFCYWTEFNGLVFNGQVSFEDAYFLRCIDSRDKRRNLVRFDNVTFDQKATFWNCQFDCIAKFTNNFFGDQADFRKVSFQKKAFFDRDNEFHDRLFLDKSYKSFSRPKDAILPYRIAKQTAHRDADSRWEGIYHYQEQCATNKVNRQKSIWKFWEKEFWWGEKSPLLNYGEWIIGRKIFGYGEKSLRPLLVGAIVILFYAAIFFGVGGINYGSLPVNKPVPAEPNQLTFEAAKYPPVEYFSEDELRRDWSYAGNCLYFSVVTFTTLGYGDFQPASGIPRLLSSSEAVLGACLMAMFVVSLSRKFVR